MWVVTTPLPPHEEVNGVEKNAGAVINPLGHPGVKHGGALL